MKNFLRGLRWTWPYRGRLFLSLGFALLAAILWGLNLSTIYPVLRVLENGKSWPDQVGDEITRLKGDYKYESEKLDSLNQELRVVETWPDGRARANRERELTGTIARVCGVMAASIFDGSIVK